MIFIYNLGIGLYWLIVRIASLFNEKAWLWIAGRKKIFFRMEAEIDKSARIAWFHAASLGEFEQGRPLMEALRKEKPEFKILLTFFSPSGYEIRKNYSGADYIYYLPLDTHGNAKRFLSIVKPSLVVFIKYEFWYHYLTQVKKNDIKLILLSAIFRNDQVFFKTYGSWYRKILKCFTHLFVQDHSSVELLKSVNITNVTYAGDTRFDRVAQIASSSKNIEIVEQFARNKFCFICGSTWPQDEELLTQYINTSANHFGFIIAPHEIHQAHINNLVQKLTVSYTLYSKAESSDLSQFRVLIIDNIGMLSSLYKYGKIAYVGGGFGTGIHNILEAAVYGMPIIFGPKYKKFREARELISVHGAFSVSTYDELNNIFNLLITDPKNLETSSATARNFITQNLGATDKILNYIKLI
jgi:3-deoxy-D-manno-octulosonic-acid transferase